ncbi:hypothetical protein [Lederbergia citri]|uniref:Uncharacterized protein n=1 Tax=Lederbergia citri TaxID=2833580 RepID=A0A942YIV7_9BACI|nr:hypothetical protein [Lederbergia citri]MBS4195756.1 hypothetical protein [Lederbergia citri]
MNTKAKLKKFQDIMAFIKTLDDEGIELLIEVAKVQVSDFVGDENELRKTLKNIRDKK